MNCTLGTKPDTRVFPFMGLSLDDIPFVWNQIMEKVLVPISLSRNICFKTWRESKSSNHFFNHYFKIFYFFFKNRFTLDIIHSPTQSFCYFIVWSRNYSCVLQKNKSLRGERLPRISSIRAKKRRPQKSVYASFDKLCYVTLSYRLEALLTTIYTIYSQCACSFVIASFGQKSSLTW